MGHLNARRLVDITEADYHADKAGERPSLSNSMAKILLDKSPLHAYHRHPRLGAGKRVESDTFDAGKLVHKLVLGKGSDIAIVEAKDWRKKVAKEAKKEAHAAGHIPALAADYEAAEKSSRIIIAKMADMGIVLEGESEVALAWSEPVAGHAPVPCRGMLDHLIVGRRRARVIDLKTCDSAHPRACAAHVVQYGYDTQCEAYTRAIEDLYPEVAGNVDFVFVFAEIDAPTPVTPGRLDGMMRERGRRRWRRAVDTWAECMAFGKWPAYVDSIVTLEAPGWVAASMQED